MKSAVPKVAIIGTRGYPSYYGGFETAIRKLAPFLAEAGWSVTVFGRPGGVARDDPEMDQRVRSISTLGIESKSLSTLSYGFFAVLKTLVLRPDVALVMNVANGYWLPLLSLARIPTLVNVDGMEWERAKWGRLARFAFRTGARFTSRFATRLVFDSREIERRWQSLSRKPGDFISYGGDVRDPLPLEPALKNRGYVLLVARFVPENSIVEFFESVKAVSSVIPVVIVGSSGYGGPLDQAASELAQSSPNVHWFGHVSDDDRLHSLWQHCALYFHGHSVGGTNPALVQAMACGSPILARDTIYNREVLGESGEFVEPVSAEIAARISELVADPKRIEDMSVRAIARAKDLYSWDSINLKYETSLRALIRKAQPSTR